MPLDPQVQVIVKARQSRPTTDQQSPAEARAAYEAMPHPKGPEVGKVQDLKAPGSHGDIPLRFYVPARPGPWPVLVYYHGGGWVVGSIVANDGTMRLIAQQSGCAVVSVGYRKAPEHKFPAPLLDCYAATQWTSENAGHLGVDAGKLAIGGASAGGNLAAAVALMAKDRGGPWIAYQVLVYPVIERNFTTRSYREHGQNGPLLTEAAMRWYWDHYLRTPQDAENPYAAPIKAHDVKGLPPALVITAECDPLRDEGAAYARRLKDAGVATAHTDYSGMPHGFFSQWNVLDKGRAAVDEVCTALRRTFRM